MTDCTDRCYNDERSGVRMHKHGLEAFKTPQHFETRTSKSRDDYATPWPIVRYLASLTERGRFSVDVCATNETAKAPLWMGPGSTIEDSLHDDVIWSEYYADRQHAVFCNPPYNDLRSWCAKAVQQAKCGTEVVLLIPARTDTTAFHMLQDQISLLVFFKGRISFEVDGEPQKGTMFPSMAVFLESEERLLYPEVKTMLFPEVKAIMKEYA